MADLGHEFSGEEVGQIFNFIQEVLIKQCWRQFAFGFLLMVFVLNSSVALGVRAD